MIVVCRAALACMIASLAALAPRSADAQAPFPGFKMPSNNVYCVLEPATGNLPADLRCDIVQMTTRPRPPKDCPLEWGDAFSITRDGNIGVRLCHGDTVRDDSLAVLAYGTQWSQGGFVCQSATTGLTCANAKGHGFMLSKAVQKLF